MIPRTCTRIAQPRKVACTRYTMKLRIEHLIEGIGSADYEALYFDETFNVAIGRSLHMGRELLRLERTSERIVRHVRCEPKRAPDSPAGRAFGSSRASFVDELDYDLRARRGAWRTIQNLMPDRVTTAGTIAFVDAPAGVRRIFDGE